MLAINGLGSTIAQALIPLLPQGEKWMRFPLPGPPPIDGEGGRYLFAQGYLEGMSAVQHNAETAAATFEANFLHIAAAIDTISNLDPLARICVIGSESGFRGSFDTAYAAAKAGMHLYIETKKLRPRQQLVGISPGIIADSGMTQRRPDQDELIARAKRHPKHRFLSALEVARMAHFALYIDQGFLTGTTIRMHGGGA